MNWLLVGLGVLTAGGACSLALGRFPRWANFIGSASAICGSAIGLVPALSVVAQGTVTAEIALPWDVPFGRFVVRMDPLSGWFVVPILGLTLLASISGWKAHQQEAGSKPVGSAWFFFNALAASMVFLIVARNVVLFLVTWELMVLFSYFLVVYDDEKPGVAAAGRTYLIASHLGTACLLAMFALVVHASGSTDFADIASRAGGPVSMTKSMMNAVFLLGLVGFGVKAGFVPFHVWAPDTYPAARSYAAALIAGMMGKTGIYGLIRLLGFLGAPPAWWGWTLIGVGLLTGIVCVLFANAQNRLGRLLAYSSLDHIGIIAVALGLGIQGLNAQSLPTAVLGFSGALLHVLNHAVFKGLLFLGAGAVVESTGTDDVNVLDGLMKKLPVVGTCFLVGCIAACGLPPLNGFVSEFLIYLGALHQLSLSKPADQFASLLVLGGLGLIGGLTISAFAKAGASAFLGAPRTSAAAEARRVSAAGWIPIVALTASCVLLPCLTVPVLRSMPAMLSAVIGTPDASIAAAIEGTSIVPLTAIVAVSLCVLALSIALAVARARLLARREVRESVTWDCGFAQPTPRIQYTGSSFSEPVTTFFQPALGIQKDVRPARGLFPTAAALTTRTPDRTTEWVYRPTFQFMGQAFQKLSWIHHGKVNLYVLYIATVTLVLVVWFLKVAI